MACFLIVSDHERSFPTEIKQKYQGIIFLLLKKIALEGFDKQHKCYFPNDERVKRALVALNILLQPRNQETNPSPVNPRNQAS